MDCAREVRALPLTNVVVSRIYDVATRPLGRRLSQSRATPPSGVDGYVQRALDFIRESQLNFQ